jgi:hypothetical protein
MLALTVDVSRLLVEDVYHHDYLADVVCRHVAR